MIHTHKLKRVCTFQVGLLFDQTTFHPRKSESSGFSISRISYLPFTNVGQVLADFYTPGLMENLLTVTFGDVAGNILSVRTFEVSTAVIIVLQAPLVMMAGEVEVVQSNYKSIL
jgi:hypothetical protein